RALRHALEISERSVPPPYRLVALDDEEGGDLGVPPGVDIGRQRGPLALVLLNGSDPLVVAPRKLLPQSRAAAHAVIPGHVVEPQEIVVRDRREAPEPGGQFGRILRDGVAAGGRAVEADAVRIG